MARVNEKRNWKFEFRFRNLRETEHHGSRKLACIINVCRGLCENLALSEHTRTLLLELDGSQSSFDNFGMGH